MVKVNNAKRILLLYIGRKSNNPNKSVFNPMKEITISGSEPPYSFKIVSKKAKYNNNKTNDAKIKYPQGLSNFELDKKRR